MPITEKLAASPAHPGPVHPVPSLCDWRKSRTWLTEALEVGMEGCGQQILIGILLCLESEISVLHVNNSLILPHHDVTRPLNRFEQSQVFCFMEGIVRS